MSSRAEWEEKKTLTLKAMQVVMGSLPGAEKRCSLDLVVEEEVECSSYLRQLITYASEPQSRTPAYLTIPHAKTGKAKETYAAVLCLHPTDHVLGHKTVVGLSAKENRSYAHELAERGFVTLAPAYPLMANYQPDLAQLGYTSGTMKAIWDNIRGLDLLESLGIVSGGFGVIGHSLGGHNGIFTAAFDSRIRAIFSNCGFDSFRDYDGGDIAGWTSERYMPELKNYALDALPFDFPDVIAALAPRHVLVSAPLHDTNFNWKSVQKAIATASPGYWAGAERLKGSYPDCGHDFPNEVREAAYEFLKRALDPRGNK